MMFKDRLSREGGGASFPELGGCVKFLIKGLFQNEKIYNWFVKTNRGILLEQVTHKIIGLMIEDRFNFPYAATIYVIEHLLELIDYYYRETTTDKHIDNVNERIGPYYHIFRYRSYITTFLNSEYGIPKNIIFPTCANIGATDLIRIRCAPILIMGVVDQPIYVDQYLNTPLDFWAHDIQHAKRQIQETLRYYDVFIKHNNYYKRRTLYNLKTLDQFYKYMESFTKEKIIPMITLKNLPKDSSDPEIQKERAMRAIKKLIIFEVVHEKAWPITQPSLCRNISLRYDEFPVENITFATSDNTGKKVIKAFHYLFADPTTIGNVVGKIRTGFYDKVSDPKDYIVPLRYRTSRNVALCAREIMEELKCSKIPDPQYFLALATDRHAMQEFKDIPPIGLKDLPPGPVPYPSKYGNNNIYSDTDLFTYFKPSVDVDDVTEQDKLHKESVVKGFDPLIFENAAGGKKKIYRRKTRRRKHRRRKKKRRSTRKKKTRRRKTRKKRRTRRR